jgi:predicted nucleotidyltransferase component of viral defense system
MTPLTRQDVLAHQREVPWPVQQQVEQDLLLCRAMVALFNDPFLKGQIAMRGGTVLHKVHLAPASRYSEDIDLVAIGDRPEEHLRAAIKRVLRDVLGPHKRWGWEELKLAIRNVAKPSRVLRVIYETPSVIEPGRTLTIVVEANVTERQPYRPVVELPFEVPFRGQALATQVNSFDIHEMLGTKMRALFQRRRGRDLFDLYWAFTASGAVPVDANRIIESFEHYMRIEGTTVPRADFLEQLDLRLADRGFCSDMQPLLRTGVHYDPQAAGRLVRERLLMRLAP